MQLLLTLAAVATSAHAYWLMGAENVLTTERMDPIVSPGKVSSHVHSVLGGSNFRLATNTSFLRESECSSIPIPQDKSNYWYPHLYFQWSNGSFTSLDGGAVMFVIFIFPHYLFDDTPGTTTAFPDDFRMLSGDPTLRTYNASSHAQQAVTFLCLDFNGVSTKYNELPSISCPSGIRAQINFPSCWDGKNTDSADHKSHVAFLSTGPDTGSCSDPNFPVVIPRIFMEVYWASNDFDSVRSQAMNSTQPFVYSFGDPTGYGYHADFMNGWDAGVLQKAVDNCHCNDFGDPTCCVDAGIFDMNQGKNCYITDAIDEQTTGTLLKLPGNNPVQPEGKQAVMFTADSTPALLSPIFVYTTGTPTATGTIVVPGVTNAASATSAAIASTTAAATTAAAATSAAVSSASAASTHSAATTSKVATATASATSSVITPSTGIPTISGSSSHSVSSGHVLSVSTSSAVHASTSVAAPASASMVAPASASIVASAPASIAAPASASAAAPSSIAAPATRPSAIGSPAGGSSLSSPSSGSKTCSSKKKRRALEQHRRHISNHVRRLEYTYDSE